MIVEQFIKEILSIPWVIPMLILSILIKVFTPIIKGKMGEVFVNLAAKLRLDSTAYTLLKDVTVPTKKGTSQIDHVFLSIYGIFVVETKFYKGWIFGTAKDRQWTQVNYKKKNRFQNPLHQNYGHICALSELLGISKEKLHGVVCFMGDAKFKTDLPEGVFLGGSYVGHIKSFTEPILTKREVESIRKRIESGRLKRGIKTNRLHVQNLRQSHTVRPKKTQVAKGSTTMKCSRCGMPMVLRTARKGKNAGGQFWGCSGFPKCRNIVGID